MTRQGDETRARLVRVAASLFQSQGYHATGIAAVLSQAGVPKGSLYHHFPGGKQDLTVAVVDWVEQTLSARITRAAEGDAPADTIVHRLFTDTAAWLEGHNYTQNALLSLLAQEVEDRETTLRQRIAQAYRDVTAQLSDVLGTAGATQPEDLATTVLAALDGGIARARAQRSAVGLHRSADLLVTVARF